MRVAYVLKKFPRLSETFILTELLALEERGVPLVIYSLRTSDDPRFHPELARLRAEIRYVQTGGNGAFADALARLARRSVDPAARARAVAGVLEFVTDPTLAPEGQPPAALLEEAAAAIRVAELADRDGVTHFHAHFATVAARVAALAARLRGVPYSITGHAKDLYRTTVNRALLDRLAREARAFVTVCDANVRHLRGALSPAGFARVRRLWNGIDVAAFAATEPRPPRAPTSPVVLAIGRLVKKKGLHVLLDAFALLARRGARPLLRIVGDGDERGALAAQASALQLTAQVTFCGAQPSDGVRRELAGATLFALPCVTDDDGNQDALPTVLLEAMAAGVPCISTTLGGVPEILDEGRAGVLVAPGDAGALADALAVLLRDDAARTRLALAGRERAQRCFDRRAAAAELATLFGAASGAIA